MRTFLVLCFAFAVTASADTLTNYVYVVNDNSAEVQSYWDSGLCIGGWIAAGLFGIWMIRVVVTGGSDKHEEE